MNNVKRVVFLGALLTAMVTLSGCKPHVYTSIGIESGWGSGPHLTGGISLGGRVH